MVEYNEKFMRQAIELAQKNAISGTGGPFGAIVVKNGEVIAEATNSVTGDNDPTAHAEVNAIRKACTILKTFQLEGCQIYSSCEPCPMCLGAVYWARPDVLFYASTKDDAASAGFDDSFIYNELKLDKASRSIPFIHKELKISEKSEWQMWDELIDKTEY